MNSYLIQQGVFKEDVRVITGIDSIIKMNYMGASEFEWGALPKSLKRIITLYRDHKLDIRFQDFNGHLFTLFIKSDDVKEAESIFQMVEDLCKDPWDKKYHFKIYPHFEQYFKGKTLTVKKRGCKLKTEQVENSMYCDFWWDIDNDWILFPDQHTTDVELALEALKEKEFDK